MNLKIYHIEYTHTITMIMNVGVQRPSGQLLQALKPVILAYVPAEQGVQANPPTFPL